MKRPFLLLSLLLLAPAAAFAQEWKDHRSDDCRCSAQFPGSPTSKNQTLRAKDGMLEQHMIMLALPGSILYAIGYVDHPKDKAASRSAEALLDESRDGSVSNVRGSVKSESKISLNGFPGRELVIDAPKDLVFVARMYIVKERLYQSIVVVPKAQLDAPENKKFLDSFKFDKP